MFLSVIYPEAERITIGEISQEDALSPSDHLHWYSILTPPLSRCSPNLLFRFFSLGYRQSFYDLLSLALPRALEISLSENVNVRKSLPWDFFSLFGIVNQNDDEEDRTPPMDRRGQMKLLLHDLVSQVCDSIPWDAAADQVALRFTQSRLPPPSLPSFSGFRNFLLASFAHIFMPSERDCEEPTQKEDQSERRWPHATHHR
jgi:hypothetical protein